MAKTMTYQRVCRSQLIVNTGLLYSKFKGEKISTSTSCRTTMGPWRNAGFLTSVLTLSSLLHRSTRFQGSSPGVCRRLRTWLEMKKESFKGKYNWIDQAMKTQYKCPKSYNFLYIENLKLKCMYFFHFAFLFYIHCLIFLFLKKSSFCSFTLGDILIIFYSWKWAFFTFSYWFQNAMSFP